MMQDAIPRNTRLFLAFGMAQLSESEPSSNRETRGELTDRTLLKRFGKGDEAAFVLLVKRYESRLLGYLNSLVWDKELSQDLCQDVFLKLLEKPPRFYHEDSLRPWLFRVARNLALDHLRRPGEVHLEPELLESAVDGDEAKTGAKAGLAAPDLPVLLVQLEEREREVVSLRIYGGLTFREIARQTSTPLSTVIWRMRQSLEQLKMILEKEEGA